MVRRTWDADEFARTFADPFWEALGRSAAPRRPEARIRRRPRDPAEVAAFDELVRRAWVDAEQRGEVRWTSARTLRVRVTGWPADDA